MKQHNDFDRSLARWFHADAQPVATGDVLERALRATRRRRPRPTLFAVLGSHWIGDGAGASARTSTIGRTGVRASMALLLLVLASVAGAVLVGAPLLEPAPGVGRLGHLAYVLEDGLYVAEWDGGNHRQIVSPSQLPGNVPKGCREFWGGPTWSPDGRYLAIRTFWDDPCSGFILITDAEGSTLTTIPATGWSIEWSPDSSRIVTWVALSETIGIYGTDGGRQRLLPAPRHLMSSGDHDPSWTPDGAAALLPRAVVVPLDGTAPYVDRRLSFPSRPRVSPDGTMIASGDGESIVVAATDGSSRRVLDSIAPSPIWQVLWSPTGDRIAFQSFDSSAGIADVATGTTISLRLPGGEAPVDVIRFSPEGDRILLRGSEAADGRSSLWSVQANGSGARELVGATDGGDWQWLPPGS